MENIVNIQKTNLALRRKRIRGMVGKILANVFIYFVLLLMYAPIVYLTVFSFTDHEVLGEWSTFTFANYTDLFDFSQLARSKSDQSKIWGAAYNTFAVAITSALIATVLGTLGAIGIFYTKKKWIKNAFDVATQIPIVNAEIVTAVSLCVLFVLCAKILPNFQRSFATLVIGHVVISIPYVVLSVGPKLQQMDPSTYEAAMDLGATQTQALWKVVIPDIVPGILSGFLLSITLSLDDYVVTAFTKPAVGGFETISTYVDGASSKGHGLPAMFRSFTAVLLVVVLIVIVVINIKSNLNRKNALKKEKNKNA